MTRPLTRPSGSTARAWVPRWALALAVALSVILRVIQALQMDIFQDGYNHWGIATNLVHSGTYVDRVGQMTQGNWLPLYDYLGAALMMATGSSSIYVLKGLSIGLSVGTLLVVYLFGERWRKGVGLIAAFLFALNPLDMLMASMAIPDNLFLFAISLGLYMLIFHSSTRRGLFIGSLAMLVAAASRYEAWPILGVACIYLVVTQRSRIGLWGSLRSALVLAGPSLVFIAGWLVYTSRFGPLPMVVFGQTASQPAILHSTTGRTGPMLAVVFWALYSANIAVLIGLSVLHVARRSKARPATYPKGSQLILGLYALLALALTVIIGMGLIVGSYRYLAIGTVALTLVGAFEAVRLTSRIGSVRRLGLARPLALATVVILMIPSMGFAFYSEQTSRPLVEPERDAGLWVHDNLNGTGGLVIVDSAITAYYTSLPQERIMGSGLLPDTRDSALSFIRDKVGIVIYLDHPTFRVRVLFPELAQGRSSGPFRLVQSFDDWRVQYGAHPIFIYTLDKDATTYPMTKDTSLRFYNSTGPHNGKLINVQKGAVMVVGDQEVIGEGAGFGTPVLMTGNTTYYPLTATIDYTNSSVTKTFILDGVEQGPMYHKVFIKVQPVCNITVHYLFQTNGSLDIKVDLSKVPLGSTLYLLNEQSGGRFYRYVDFAGNDTTVDFSWRPVNAWYNYLIDAQGVGFRVDFKPPMPGGVSLYLGRETRPEGFDWAGLDYELDLKEFSSASFEYSVHMED